MLYLFPFADIPKGSRVILYGAETVGYDFYRQIKTSKFCNVVKWVDRQYLWYRGMNLPVDAPETILSEEFDYVVITARERRTYEGIKNYLLGLGVKNSSFIWRDDYELMPDFVATYDENRVRREAESAKLIEPASCVTDNRLDVIIRLIYAEAFIQNRLSEFEISLYNRVIEAINNYTEPMGNILVNYFSNYESKKGIETFRNSFDNLIISLQKHGYNKIHFLPLDRFGRLCNGAHRCAATIALNMKAFAYVYDFDGSPYPFTKEWLLEKGFSSSEIDIICQKYMSIKGIDNSDGRKNF